MYNFLSSIKTERNVIISIRMKIMPKIIRRRLNLRRDFLVVPVREFLSESFSESTKKVFLTNLKNFHVLFINSPVKNSINSKKISPKMNFIFLHQIAKANEFIDALLSEQDRESILPSFLVHSKLPISLLISNNLVVYVVMCFIKNR